jgi:hypothetical protein
MPVEIANPSLRSRVLRLTVAGAQESEDTRKDRAALVDNRAGRVENRGEKQIGEELCRHISATEPKTVLGQTLLDVLPTRAGRGRCGDEPVARREG